MAIASTYPIGTSDGNEKYLGTQAIDGAVRLYPRPAGDVSRTAAAAATIDAAVKTLRTTCFALPGDRGRGNYNRRQTTPYELWTSKDYVPTHATVQNASGNFYRLITRPVGAATSTIQPTHTTFTEVAGADGFGWLRINQEPQYIRSVDRYCLDSTTSALHGGWWELELENGSEVLVEQLGGKADHTPGSTTSTDNWDAIMAAHYWVQFDPAANTASDHGPTLVFGIGRYRSSKTVIAHNILKIKGAYIGFDASGAGQATQLYFTNTTGSAFCFLSNNVGPNEDSGTWGAGQNTGSAIGSILEGFAIYGTWDHVTPAASNDFTAAVRSRTLIKCIQVSVHSWRSNGFHVHGTVGAGASYPFEGNANCWRLIDCYVHSCGGHAQWIAGMDVNGGYSTNFITHNGPVMGCGINDSSGLGCTHIQPQITGYGNKGVCHNGKHYCLIGGNGSTTTPGTNDRIWYYLRDGPVIAGAFDAWNAANDYSVMKLAMFGSSASTTFVSPYVEGNNIRSHSAGPVIGSGDSTWTRYTPGRGDRAAAIAYNLSDMSGPEVDANGGGITRIDYGIEHYPGGLALGPQFITWNRARHGDGVRGSFGWVGRDVFWQAAGQELGNTNKFVFRITEKDTDIDYGTGVGIDNTSRMILMDMGLSNLEGFAANPTTRVFGLREASPTLVGTYSKGSRYLNSETGGAGTTAQWICSQTGVIAHGAWSAGSAGAGTVVSTTSGRFYRLQAFATTTIEPSHLSGTQTLADGATWTYLGNSTPIFTLDAIVVKQTNSYTVTNATTDRALDANSTTTDELADVLGTLISDLKLAGILT